MICSSAVTLITRSGRWHSPCTSAWGGAAVTQPSATRAARDRREVRWWDVCKALHYSKKIFSADTYFFNLITNALFISLWLNTTWKL